MGGSSTISTSAPRINALQVQRSAYGVPIPIGWGRFRVSGNLIWAQDFAAIPVTTTSSAGGKGGGATQKNTTYTYQASIIIGLGEQIGSVRAVYRDKEVFVNGATTALAQAGLSLKSGALGQSVWGYLSTNHPDQAIGYTQTAYAYAANYTLNDNAGLQNHSFECDGNLQVPGLPDANPADVIVDFLTNSAYGVPLWTADLIGDLSTYSGYCLANSLLISPCLSEQRQASDVLTEWTRASNSEIVASEGKLKIIPYGDAAATGNGATFTPDLTPLYALTEDDFLAGVGEDPITIEDKVDADAYNQVQVEFLNRAHQYDVETMPAQDQANIEEFGLRKQDPVSMHCICDAGVARHVAQLLLQRQLYVRLTFTFKLGWKYCLLEPMDLVTLTHPRLNLISRLVRITQVEEDEDGELSITAEDMQIGTASAPVYPSQTALGFGNNSAALPGDVATPILFNPPGNLANGAREIWAAVAGQTLDWGGCEVWVSQDGTNYTRAGVINGPARYGVTTASLPAHVDPDSDNSLPVNLEISAGTLNSATSAEVAAAVTKCWLGGEVIAYRDATLTAANRYTLGYLRRGLQNTPPAAHASGTGFVRLDDAVFKLAYDVEQIGKTIHVKFPSFNGFGQQLQDLAAVTDYTVTLGARPPDLSGFAANVSGSTAVFSWNAVTALQVLNGGFVVIRYTSATSGATWDTSTEVLRAPGNATQISGSYAPGTYLAKAIDSSGVESLNSVSLGGASGGGTGGTLTVTASPSSVTKSSSASSATSPQVVVSTSGGVGTLTRAWSRVSGSTRISISSSTAAAVTFSIADLAGSGDSATAVWKCTVTDSTSGTPQVVDSNNVTISFIGTDPPSGGGATP